MCKEWMWTKPFYTCKNVWIKYVSLTLEYVTKTSSLIGCCVNHKNQLYSLSWNNYLSINYTTNTSMVKWDTIFTTMQWSENLLLSLKVVYGLTWFDMIWPCPHPHESKPVPHLNSCTLRDDQSLLT